MARDCYDTDWTTEDIEQLGDVLCKFPDVFPKLNSGFGSCSLMPFAISVQEGSTPVRSRPHRINPILAKEVEANLDQYLAAGLIRHSTSRYWSPLVFIPEKSGGVRFSVEYTNFNQISTLSQLTIPRVDQVLHASKKGRVFSLFDLVCSFHKYKSHKETIPLTAFRTPRASTSWSSCPEAAVLRPAGSSK